MPLTVKVLSYKGQPPIKPLSGSFDQDGGTLGRSSENQKNHFILPDPERYISRKHAVIKYENGCYFLTDTSVGGTYIINKNIRLQRDTVQIANGDKLRIGDYELVVCISLSEAFDIGHPPVNSCERDSFFFELNPEQKANKELGSEKSNSSEKAFSWSENDILAKKPLKHLSMESKDEPLLLDDYYAPPDIASTSGHSQEIPKDFNFEDLLNDVNNRREPYADPKARPSQLLESENIQSGPEGVLKTPHAGTEIDSVREHQDLPSNGKPSASRSVVKSNHVSSKRAQPTYQQAHHELFKTFLGAAKIKETDFFNDEEIPELMETVGAVFREMIEGLMTILRGRAELKAQFRVSATVLGPADNNPLKFTPIVEDALKLLLTRNHPGFVDAVHAVQEGFADIMNHQLAMTAGIQAALIKLFERLDPKHFSKPYEEGLVFQKKAKSWDAYNQAFRKIVNDGMEDFFGEDFVKGYEEQINKLRAKQNKT